MKQYYKRSQWVGCSNFQERINELQQAHEEFVQEFIVTTTRRRPRIYKEPNPRKVEISVMDIKVTIDFTEWQAHGSIGTIIKRIY